MRPGRTTRINRTNDSSREGPGAGKRSRGTRRAICIAPGWLQAVNIYRDNRKERRKIAKEPPPPALNEGRRRAADSLLVNRLAVKDLQRPTRTDVCETSYGAKTEHEGKKCQFNARPNERGPVSFSQVLPPS